VGQSKFFEAFMKQQVPIKKEKAKTGRQGFLFALFTDDNGVYIKTVNSSLRDKKVNADHYSGNLKTIIELYNRIKTKNKLIVDWNNPYSNIYLDRNPELLDVLSLVDNIIDSNGKKIYCGSTEFPIVLSIVTKDGFLHCDVTVCDSRIDELVSDKYALVGNRLIATLPLGPGYKSLVELNAIIETKELGSYLSIVFSNFSNIDVKYNGYRVESAGECEISPSLIIESIDDSGFLNINTTFSYREFISPEFYHLQLFQNPLIRHNIHHIPDGV